MNSFVLSLMIGGLYVLAYWDQLLGLKLSSFFEVIGPGVLLVAAGQAFEAFSNREDGDLFSWLGNIFKSIGWILLVLPIYFWYKNG